MNALRPIQPTQLYIACDGPLPNSQSEALKVSNTRLLIRDSIDWNCDVKYFYSDVNQGCRLGVSRAITWFFEQVPEGIILEDDCVPHPSFFGFCETLLERYRDNSRVWQICGTNHLPCHSSDYDYFFSRYGPIWGWASWRRAWLSYDSELSMWPKMKIQASDVYLNPQELAQKLSIGDKLYSQKFDTWDYQWAIINAFNGGINIIPKINLIENVGFGFDATHTTTANRPLPTIDLSLSLNREPVGPFFPIRDKCYDDAYARSHFRKTRSFRARIKSCLSKITKFWQ